MIAPMLVNTRGHGHAYVLHARVGMIATLCAYKRGQDHAYAQGLCMNMRLCVHIRVGIIAHMCAYTRGHDRAYVSIYV
jgi:hypothetical protein